VIRKRTSYPIEFKLKVVQEAKKIGDRSAARVFGINQSCVSKWRGTETFLQEAHDKQIQKSLEQGHLSTKFKIRKRTFDESE